MTCVTCVCPPTHGRVSKCLCFGGGRKGGNEKGGGTFLFQNKIEDAERFVCKEPPAAQARGLRDKSKSQGRLGLEFGVNQTGTPISHVRRE